MIISKETLAAIRDVYGCTNIEDEVFGRDVIILLCAGHYDLKHNVSAQVFPTPIFDCLCYLIGRTGRIDYEPIYCNFDNEKFVSNFIEYCLKKDYDVALQNLLYYCAQNIKDFEHNFAELLQHYFCKK